MQGAPRDEPLSNDVEMSNIPSRTSEERASEAAGLDNIDDNAVLDARYSSNATSLDINDIQEGDIEDGLVKIRDQMKGRRDWKGLWRNMTVRSRRDTIYEDVPDEDGLLLNTNTTRQTTRKSSLFSCCVLWSISGLAILYGYSPF
jgi:hypothetical protein